MSYLSIGYLSEFFSVFNTVDYCFASIVLISLVIGARLGIKRELLALMVMVLPSLGTFYVPTNLVEEYLAEILVNQKIIKLAASFIVCILFFFITILIKKNIQKKMALNNSILSFDAILGLIFGIVRGYAILIFLVIAHAHFFSTPIEAMQKSIIVKTVKNHLLGIDQRFEMLLQHTDKEAAEIEKNIFKEIQNNKSENLIDTSSIKHKKSSQSTIKENQPIVDINTDDSTPEIEP